MLDKDLIKESLTVSEIERIFEYYNAGFRYSEKGDIIGQTICHNKSDGSFKLYYYPESQTFYCYTECACAFDVFEFVQRIEGTRNNEIDFYESVKLVSNITGISKTVYQKESKGFQSRKLINDWDFISKYKRRAKREVTLGLFDDRVLDNFEKWYPKAWLEEGIAPITHKKFDIRFFPDNNQTVIPHRNAEGELIGIRIRNWRDTFSNKYMPLYYNDEMYNHALSYNLYGLYENLDTIKKVKKVMIVESEKSVLKSHSYFGDENFCVAICGSNMSEYQANMLIELGVEKVIIALDKDYEEKPDVSYQERVYRIARHFTNKASVYHITDTNNRVDAGECVLDMPKEVVIDTMREDKYLVSAEELLQ